MTTDTLPPAGDSFSMCIIIMAEYHSVIFLFDYHYSAKQAYMAYKSRLNIKLKFIE